MTTLRGMIELQCYVAGQNSFIEVKQLHQVSGYIYGHHLTISVVFAGPFDLIGAYFELPNRYNPYYRSIYGLEISFDNIIGDGT